MQSVRNEITNCVEKSYKQLSCQALLNMLMINDMSIIQQIAGAVYIFSLIHYWIERLDHQ